MRKASAMAATLLVVALGAAGCVRTQARTTPEVPPLNVPPPPPRNVEPMVAEVPPPVSLVDEPARTPVRSAVPAPRTEPRPEPPKPEPPVADAKPAEEVPKQQVPSTLKTLPSDKADDLERSIRAQLSGAVARLNRIDYKTLSAGGRTTFEQARGFVAQAEEALKVKNLPFAATVTDKALTLAIQLAGR